MSKCNYSFVVGIEHICPLPNDMCSFGTSNVFKGTFESVPHHSVGKRSTSIGTATSEALRKENRAHQMWNFVN
ncbi:hypothetical protein TNCT_131061 [Trichonephila clavata]|uniref:Uncharacterized protein n=1 Tax=Trichonephila clavata TaxID=2740835 RepID=A0A8X6KPJ5_TRICU|nr:hypothetical protein TNCT_131061 [Trichonephila clavata]